MSYMEDNGMYTVFLVYDPDIKTEIYLLDDWGADEDGKVSEWVQTLTTRGVGYGKGNYLPICNFDCDNIAWIRKSVLVSITLELWETIKKDPGYDASGPEFFCSIIQNQQRVNSSAICALIQALKTMRLTDKSIQDVETFSNNMAEMAGRIRGIGSNPIYMYTLVANFFIDFAVLDFHLKDKWLHDLVERNPKSCKQMRSSVPSREIPVYQIPRTVKYF